ncbi:hypothetical protein SCHPADRAFT_247374 [Schizopora paradoxa]|uniref:Uncharacterized protein n=1 Tax=Schizopora paradoxa TaxID=27342 RepID=A0A0H2RV51_9AGAM|nr:hypothetical protein SCHPADRAFT_247374 [Schizopora paradoxa]
MHSVRPVQACKAKNVHPCAVCKRLHRKVSATVVTRAKAVNAPKQLSIVSAANRRMFSPRCQLYSRSITITPWILILSTWVFGNRVTSPCTRCFLVQRLNIGVFIAITSKR